MEKLERPFRQQLMTELTNTCMNYHLWQYENFHASDAT